MTTEHDPIPEYVLEALEAVRAAGPTNMLDRMAVIHYIPEYADDETMYEAAAWVADNSGRYMEALKAMGARRVAR